jgi:hypothetical protein
MRNTFIILIVILTINVCGINVGASHLSDSYKRDILSDFINESTLVIDCVEIYLQISLIDLIQRLTSKQSLGDETDFEELNDILGIDEFLNEKENLSNFGSRIDSIFIIFSLDDKKFAEANIESKSFFSDSALNDKSEVFSKIILNCRSTYNQKSKSQYILEPTPIAINFKSS